MSLDPRPPDPRPAGAHQHRGTPPVVRLRRRRPVVAGAVVGLAVATAVTSAVASARPRPLVTLVAATGSVDAVRAPDEPPFLDLGLNLVAGDRALVFTVHRDSYRSPVVSTLTIGKGRSAVTRRLPRGLADMQGLHDVVHAVIKDASGTTVAEQSYDWCPGNAGGFFFGGNGLVRARPDAPETSPWPGFCSGSPFMLGNVFGIQRGWAGSVDNGLTVLPSDLPDGDYEVSATVSPAWRAVLGVAASTPAVRTVVHLTTDTSQGCKPVPGPGPVGSSSAASSPTASSPAPTDSPTATVTPGPTDSPTPSDSATPTPSGSPTPCDSPTPTASASASGLAAAGPALRASARSGAGHDAGSLQARHDRVLSALSSSGRDSSGSDDGTPGGVPSRWRPDLRPLPAWNIQIAEGSQFSDPSLPIVPPDHDFLTFGATVWNGGTSQLTVDGFRAPGAGLMQAYQSFYDRPGHKVGMARVGSMQYDPRPGHQHWHFLDFAQYNLLDASKRQVVRSQKEAFCLAPTDAIDLTLPQANWSPGALGFFSQCGGPSALGIRENLDVGWGDTYGQFLPGQSFDVTDLKNGTYYVEVVANPFHHLVETDLTNNRSLRRVVIGGTPGNRTVDVPPFQGIDA